MPLLTRIIPDAFVIAVVIFATNISLSKMFGKKWGYKVDPNQVCAHQFAKPSAQVILTSKGAKRFAPKGSPIDKKRSLPFVITLESESENRFWNGKRDG